MTEARGRAIFRMLLGSLAVVVSLQSPLAVRADDAQDLKPETASIDVTDPRPEPAPTISEHRVLYGAAKKHDLSANSTTSEASQTGTSENAPLNANAVDNDARLKSETADADAQKAAFQKLVSGADMSSDDYRALGWGVTGLESTRYVFEKYGRVTAVYPGSPADQAGIRKGEKEVWKDIKLRPGQTLQVTFHPAGKSVDVIIVRHGEPVLFSLVTQNVEDIQDPKIRRMWEKMIRETGYPREGIFTGTSVHNLGPAR